MTNRERLTEIKRVEPIIAHIKKCAKEIIYDTYDYHVTDIIEVVVHAEGVELICSGHSYSETYTDCYVIPIEWFDEGFDYKSAYRELLREAEEKRVKAEAEEKQKQKKLQEKEEYDTYLKLKEKYEAVENK